MRDHLPSWLRRSLVTRKVCLEAADALEAQEAQIRRLTAERNEASLERDDFRERLDLRWKQIRRLTGERNDARRERDDLRTELSGSQTNATRRS